MVPTSDRSTVIHTWFDEAAQGRFYWLVYYTFEPFTGDDASANKHSKENITLVVEPLSKIYILYFERKCLIMF